MLKSRFLIILQRKKLRECLEGGTKDKSAMETTKVFQGHKKSSIATTTSIDIRMIV